MSSSSPEVVPPSSEPDAAVATGSGRDAGATPPPPPTESASTSGLGPQTEQQGSSAKGDAPYDLSGTGDSTDDGTGAQSPSGT